MSAHQVVVESEAKRIPLKHKYQVICQNPKMVSGLSLVQSEEEQNVSERQSSH